MRIFNKFQRISHIVSDGWQARISLNLFMKSRSHVIL